MIRALQSATLLARWVWNRSVAKSSDAEFSSDSLNGFIAASAAHQAALSALTPGILRGMFGLFDGPAASPGVSPGLDRAPGASDP